MDHAGRGEDAAIAGPAQAEGEVDVLVVLTEEQSKRPGASQGLGPVEGARAAGAEDLVAGAGRPGRGGLAVAALGRPADEA